MNILYFIIISILAISLPGCIDSKAAGSEVKTEQPLVVLTNTRPDPAYIEKRGQQTRLNFDFELKNRGSEDVDITFIGMRLFDSDGAILTRRSMGGNGLPGPIKMLPDSTIPAGRTRYVFNPFPDQALPGTPTRAVIVVAYTGGDLQFEMEFHTPPGPMLERLPLSGVSHVFSGNDLFAHHRRVSLDHAIAVSLGMKHVAQRYALDFTRIDLRTGDLFKNSGAERSDWFGYGVEVFAPIAGRVVAVRSSMPDNSFDASGERVFAEGFQDYGSDRGLGNYLILDVGDGAYLVASHFRKGTISLEIGDQVEAGELLGEIGMSGDTAYPHLHIQLQDGIDYIQSKPLPISFACVDDGVVERKPGAVDTGDLVSPCETEGLSQ